MWISTSIAWAWAREYPRVSDLIWINGKRKGDIPLSYTPIRISPIRRRHCMTRNSASSERTAPSRPSTHPLCDVLGEPGYEVLPRPHFIGGHPSSFKREGTLSLSASGSGGAYKCLYACDIMYCLRSPWSLKCGGSQSPVWVLHFGLHTPLLCLLD